jgi:hypothetical protein
VLQDDQIAVRVAGGLDDFLGATAEHHRLYDLDLARVMGASRQGVQTHAGITFELFVEAAQLTIVQIGDALDDVQQRDLRLVR